MKFSHIALAAALTVVGFAGSAHAADDAVMNKCRACHTWEAGKKGKQGPNLFGIVGSAAGSNADFKYNKSSVLPDVGAKGVVWDAALIDEYLQDPTKFLQRVLGDAKAKSKMTFKLKGADKADERAAIIEFLSNNK
ncbi:cytochrome c, class I [Magnetococcus marinus MC-1]|uniref:Cytochrome c, class I n=1 Tax=Magnetococcus marinus (strain ATCC BAA-1437 / JCM 17883 / MC-1) TaxID=156889 RepID=A0LDJ5_MAGMM|nr:cytochrome C, class I [Magnetococcus marinus]ABK46038.1 cytochrome c, class I [Magnetococcus marinus MC-1]